MGLDMDFDWGDITEIMNKGFAMRYNRGRDLIR